MPMTEDELRAALRSRTQAVPGTPGLADRAEKQGRRQQAGLRAAGAVGLVAALAISAVAVLPRQSAAPTPPATSSPTASPSTTAESTTFTTTATVDGLETSVTGPSAVDGTTRFQLELTVANPAGGTSWTGNVAAGILYDQRVPGYFDGDLLAAVDGGQGTQVVVALPEVLTSKAFGGLQAPGKVTLEPGETRSWTFDVARSPGVPDDGDAQGWVALLTSDRIEGLTATGLDPTSGRRIAFTPQASNLSCASPSVVGQRGEVGPWGLEYVATATVSADRRATWEEVPGVDAEGGTSFDSTQTGNVLASVVIRSLGEQGFPASGYGAGRPEQAKTLAPGSYVAYSAVRMVDISFAGSCGPSGEPISGTWRGYDSQATGIYDCSRPASSGPERKAAAYCPKD